MQQPCNFNKENNLSELLLDNTSQKIFLQMNENSVLLSESSRFQKSLNFLHEDKKKLQSDMFSRNHSMSIDQDSMHKSYQALNSSVSDNETAFVRNYSDMDNIKLFLSVCLKRAPALVIAVLLNLFFGVSFGQAFFPTSWDFPDGVPRVIGVQVPTYR